MVDASDRTPKRKLSGQLGGLGVFTILVLRQVRMDPARTTLQTLDLEPTFKEPAFAYFGVDPKDVQAVHIMYSTF
jgi:hypothetical protein